MENIEHIRFFYLVEEYKNKTAAIEGFKYLRNFIKFGRSPSYLIGLSDFLKSIRMTQQNAISSLLQFYSILEISLIANYISISSINSDMESEIRDILGDRSVQELLLIRNDLILPQLLFIQSERKIDFQFNNQTDVPGVFFEEFLVLINRIKNDSEIKAYFTRIAISNSLDPSIKSFFDEAIKGSKGDDHLQDALNGFLKFTNVLIDFHHLLIRLKSYNYLQSAFWHFLISYYPVDVTHRTWERNKIKMRNGVDQFSFFEFTKNFESEDFDYNITPNPLNDLYLEWQTETKKELEKADDSLSFMMNTKSGESLISLYNDYFANSFA